MNTNVESSITTSLTIRPFAFTDADYESVNEIYNLIWPDNPTTVEVRKHHDKHWDEQYFRHRAVVEINAQPVAFGICSDVTWSHKPGKYYVNCNVHPNFDGQGIDDVLFDHLMDELAARNPHLLQSSTREDRPQSVRFLEKHGFKMVMRFPFLELDLESFDPDAFASHEEHMATEGINIVSVAELQKTDPGWAHKLYELRYEITKDVPGPDAVTKEPFEQYEKNFLKRPNFLPEAKFVAIDGERYVGLTSWEKNDALDGKLKTRLTGVVRSHRRKGVCTALKVRALRYAKDCGAKVIVTDTEENNPMYHINVKLGFTPLPAWMDFQKEIKRTSS